jgi:putative oxidoreductase
MIELTTGLFPVATRASEFYRQAIRLLEDKGAGISDLLIRCAVFRVFFWSGLAKIDNWSGTVQLFEYEYMVPLLSPSTAAFLAVLFELDAACLVLIGLGARLAALPLLAMTLIIQFVLGMRDPAYYQIEHYLWMVLLIVLIQRGPGRWSIDGMIRRRLA